MEVTIIFVFSHFCFQSWLHYLMIYPCSIFLIFLHMFIDFISFGDVNHGMYDGNLRFGGTAIRHYDKDSRSYQNRVQSGKMDSVDYSEAMDYDSEISEIQDGQKKILYKPKKGSLNYSKMCKPTRKVFVRPSFNLLASSFQNSEEDDDLIRDNTLYQAVPPPRSHTVVDIPVQVPVPVPVSIGTTLRRKASIHSVDRVGSSATIVKSILSESSPRQHQSLASIEGPWVAIPSVSSKVSNVATDHGGQSQKNMAIAACTSSYQLSPLKGEDERFQSECVTTVNISLPDTRQSRVVSVASSATSTFIATKQCTPLQLYSFMPENDSTGFECPFSIIESTNESLLRLLDPHSPVTTSTVRHDSLAILSPAATRKQNKQSRGPVVEQGNVSKEVYARCLSYLANESFTSISPVPTFSRSLGVSSIGVLNSCESNLLVEGCDHLSQFTWKLVEAFHSDLKSAFIVYEALVSTFAPNFSVPPVACNTKEMSISVDTHSPVTTFSSFGEESNNNLPSIFTNPTQLSFDSLCTLEEYLSGVLVLFVKVRYYHVSQFYCSYYF